MDHDFYTTFSKLYGLDEAEFTDVSVNLLNLSYRTAKRFHQSGIVTIADLLQKTPSEMMEIKGFGAGCLTELKQVLSVMSESGLQDFSEQTEVFQQSVPAVSVTEADVYQRILEGAEILISEDSVERLPLSVRASNCLQRLECAKIVQMLALPEADLRKLSGAGEKFVQEVFKWQRSLRTGEDGFFYVEDVTENSWKPTDEQKKIICELQDQLNVKAARSAVILRLISSEQEFVGEELLRKLYAVPMIHSALSDKILQISGDDLEGVPISVICSRLPDHLENTAVLEEALHCLVSGGKLREREGYYRCGHQNLDEFAETLPERYRDVLLCRLEGKKLAEIGSERNLTRERVRQLENKALRNRPRLEEDRYLPLFEKYLFSQEDFILAFDESAKTYNYLDLVAQGKAESRRPLEEILDDESVSARVKKKAKRAVYKDYVHLGGRMIPKKRQELVRYAVQRFAQNKISYQDFVSQYHAFLEEIGLENDEHLVLNGNTYANYLSACDYALWNYNHAFRYYSFASRDFSELLEVLNLKQYENMELSANKFIREYPELMRQYDIRDGYELHGVLRKIPIPDVDIHFSRMPIFVVGTADREKQAMDLMVQCAPISALDLSRKYEEEYGVSAETALGGYFKHLNSYLHNGLFNVDFPALPEDQERHMKEILTEDFYLHSHIIRLYQRDFPGESAERINPYAINRLGFRVYSGYVIRNTYESAKDYFTKFLTEHDRVDLRSVSQDMMYRSSFSTLMYDLRAKRQIIEFAPKQYINVRKLEGIGYGKEKLQEFCDFVASKTEKGTFFTMQFLRSVGFAHDLDDLGFDDYFCSALLAEDKDHFSYRNVGTTKLFLRGVDEVTMEKFLLWILDQKQSVEIYDLIDLLENTYGIKTDITDLRATAQSAGLYYDNIMEKLYIDYDTYFEEV